MSNGTELGCKEYSDTSDTLKERKNFLNKKHILKCKVMINRAL